MKREDELWTECYDFGGSGIMGKRWNEREKWNPGMRDYVLEW
jgi:hypothetical protein